MYVYLFLFSENLKVFKISKFVLNAQIRLVGPSPANVARIVADINRQLNGINAKVNINVNNVTKNLQKVSKAAKGATSDIEKFGEQAALAIRRYGAFTLATGGFIKLTQAISSGIDEAVKFDREIVRVAQVTGQSVKSLSGLSKEITRLSTTFGTSSSDLVKVSSTLAQAGLSAKDTKVALEALAKTGVSATFGNINNTTEATIALMQQFNIDAKDLESTLSSINKVSAAFAVESDDIAVAVRRAGGAFEAAGGNLNEFIALFTSVRQTTRESAESIATGFRTIFTRLQRLKTQDFFKQFNIELRDMKGNFVGPYEAIRKISDALKNIDSTSPQFSQIVEELGGFRQVSKVVPLLQQFAVSEKALQVAIRGGNSLTEDAAAAQDALAIKLAKVKEEFADLIRTVASNETFRGMVDVTLELTRALIQLTKSLEPLLPLLATFGVVTVGAQTGKFLKGFNRKIFGFSSGGMVPGSGNRDTVPAMLTPGEFVLNKKTVEKLGIQKFAEGGTVQASNFTKKEDLKAALMGAGFSETVANKAGNLLKEGNTKAAQKLIDTPAKIAKVKADKQQDREARTITFDGSGFSMLRPFVGGREELNVSNQASSILKASSSSSQKIESIFSSLGINPTDIIKGTITSFGLDQGAAGKIDGQIETAFSQAIDSVTKNIVGTNGIINPKDPPALDKLISSSAIGSIKGQFFEAIIRRAASDFLKSGEADQTFDFNPVDKKANTTHGNLDLLFGKGVKLPADAKGGKISDAKLEMVNKAIRYSNGSILHKPKKMATGGSVGGSGNGDTVPALLTPGEFVVTKKAASQIGHGTLNKINKFASGGLVGKTASLGSSPIVQIAGLSIIQSLIDNLTKVDGEFGKIANTLTKVGVASVALVGIVKSVQGNLRESLTAGGFGELSFGTKFGGRGNVFKSGRSAKQFFRRATIGGAAAGIGSNLAGEFVSSNASAKIASGKDATGQAALGGALSGIGVGATIGAAFGPFGIAIGAAAGGLIGFTKALSESKAELKNVLFARRMDELTDKISQFGKGRLNNDELGKTLIPELSKTFSEFGGASPEERKDLTTSFKNQATEIERYFQNVARSSDTLEDFDKAAGKSLLQFAILTNTPIASLKGEIEKLIGAEKKELALVLAANKARTEEVRTLQNIVTLASAFEDAVGRLNDVSEDIDNFVSLLEGSGIPQLQQKGGLFERAAEGRISDKDRIFTEATRITDRVGLNNNIASSVADMSILLNKLPEIIDSFNNFGDSQTPATSIAKIAQNNFGINNEEVLQKLTAAISKEVGQAQDTNTFGHKADLPQVEAEKLRDLLKHDVKLFADIAKLTDDEKKTVLDKTKKIGEIVSKEVDLRIDILSRLQDFDERINDIRGKTPTFKGGLDNLNARIGVTGNNINTDFVGEIDDATRQIKQITQNINDGKDLEKNRVELDKQNNRLNNLNKGFDILIKDTSALSNGFRELEKEEEKRRFRGDIVGTSVFGGAEERQSFNETFINTIRASKAGNLNTIPLDERRGVEGFLKSAGETPIAGTPASKILETLVRSELKNLATVAFGPKEASSKDVQDLIDKRVQDYIKNGTTSAQDKLIKEMQDFVNKQATAGNQFADSLGKGAQDLRTVLASENKIFLDNLQKIFLQREKNEIAGKKSETQDKIKDVDKFATVFTELSGGKNISKDDLLVQIEQQLNTSKRASHVLSGEENILPLRKEFDKILKNIEKNSKSLENNVLNSGNEVYTPNYDLTKKEKFAFETLLKDRSLFNPTVEKSLEDAKNEKDIMSIVDNLLKSNITNNGFKVGDATDFRALVGREKTLTEQEQIISSSDIKSIAEANNRLAKLNETNIGLENKEKELNVSVVRLNSSIQESNNLVKATLAQKANAQQAANDLGGPADAFDFAKKKNFVGQFPNAGTKSLKEERDRLDKAIKEQQKKIKSLPKNSPERIAAEGALGDLRTDRDDVLGALGGRIPSTSFFTRAKRKVRGIIKNRGTGIEESDIPADALDSIPQVPRQKVSPPPIPADLGAPVSAFDRHGPVNVGLNQDDLNNIENRTKQEAAQRKEFQKRMDELMREGGFTFSEARIQAKKEQDKSFKRPEAVAQFSIPPEKIPGKNSLDLNPLDSAINKMNETIRGLSETFSKIPTEISVMGTHTVNVQIVGGEVLTRIEPAVRAIVEEEINNGFNKLIDAYMPNIPRQYNQYKTGKVR